MRREGISGFKAFVTIWFGQLVSLTGTGLTAFALGVWVYLSTGSATLFALIQLATSLPGILLSPLAGALVDRWDRRWAMILSDAMAAACTAVIWLLLRSGQLHIWHIYVLLAISASFGSFQWPAYSAATSQLVPPKQLGRAAGMVQLAEGLAEVLAPVTAAMLMVHIMVQGVMFIDLVTFGVALFTLMLVRVPQVARAEPAPEESRSLLREAGDGWRYIRARRGLFALLIFFAITNFTTGITGVLLTPMVLGLTTTEMLGVIASAGGLGFLAGGALMSAWGGPKNKMTGVYAAELIIGAMVVVMGLVRTPAVLAACLFVTFSTIPLVTGCSQAIWQIKTPIEIQGRVFSFRRVIAMSAAPLAFLLAGPLSDLVFNPWLVEGGSLAGSLGQVIGVGPTRGIGLLYVILGIITLAVTLAAMAYGPLRRVEQELPDALTDERVEAGETVAVATS